ncbi:hypothetical protein NUW54_g13005 [Trametes sanguinea]|uniref:Uncharacterized protein n=1 Tax=Trametes sanguinea TaxID=158606 RepID=A0ACC1MR25_9APHY|nr:hypothetical protein NUW54_g13005 [Trametes sanguinea]
MAQGQIKGLQKQKSSGGRHAAKAAAAPKKGKRYIAPKKTAAVKQAALHKVSLRPMICPVLSIHLLVRRRSLCTDR